MKGLRSMKALKIFLLIALVFSARECLGAAPYAKPMGAYQTKFDMFFSVWKPDGLPSAWFATFDGYPVREFANNQWIYGIISGIGDINDSEILVGSVDPSEVFFLRPLPQFSEIQPAGHKNIVKSLLNILDSDCDSFSVIKTEASFTPIAWKSGTSKIFIWSGKEWVAFKRFSGESFKSALNREALNAARYLRSNGVRWSRMDSAEFADFVRTAGYIWFENFASSSTEVLNIVQTDNGGGDNYSSGFSGNGNKNDDGGWDTGR